MNDHNKDFIEEQPNSCLQLNVGKFINGNLVLKTDVVVCRSETIRRLAYDWITISLLIDFRNVKNRFSLVFIIAHLLIDIVNTFFCGQSHFR